MGLVLGRTDSGSPVARDQALAEVAPVLAGMGETAGREDLVRRVAERLDLDPAMVMGRVVASTPVSGGTRTGAAAGTGARLAAGPAASRRGS